LEGTLKKTVLTLSIAVLAWGASASAAPQADTATQIIALERRAMDGWHTGNPDPLLALSHADITYFHVMTETRVNGLPALKAIVEPFRGRALFDSYDMLEPKVQLGKDMAVLTYVLVRRNGPATSRWNATQVYQRKAVGWRVIHTHWSMTKPNLGPAPQP
jgi:hypothetical protein